MSYYGNGAFIPLKLKLSFLSTHNNEVILLPLNEVLTYQDFLMTLNEYLPRSVIEQLNTNRNWQVVSQDNIIFNSKNWTFLIQTPNLRLYLKLRSSAHRMYMGGHRNYELAAMQHQHRRRNMMAAHAASTVPRSMMMAEPPMLDPMMDNSLNYYGGAEHLPGSLYGAGAMSVGGPGYYPGGRRRSSFSSWM